MMRAYFLPAAFLFASAVWLPAAEYLGAKAVLKKAAENAAVEEPQKELNPAQALAGKLDAYEKQAGQLSEEEAAAQWLALLDGLMMIPQQLLYVEDNAEKLSLPRLIEILPPSRTWDALAAAIEKRPKDKHPLREQTLVLLAAILRDDDAGRKKALETFQKQLTGLKKMESHERQYIQQTLDRTATYINSISGSSEEMLNTLKKTLDEHEKQAGSRRHNNLDIPDLLRDADEAEAAPLIRRALLLDTQTSFTGKRTRRLAARLALENLQDMKKPAWQLIETEADLPLYEGLVKKFPEPEQHDYSRSQADTVYFLHLVALDRTEDAARLVKELASEGQDRRLSLSMADVENMQKQGFGRQMLSFLKHMLEEDPTLSLWGPFIQLSAQQGESAAALEFLRTAAARPALTGTGRADVEKHLAAALLAADQADEGVKLLREMVQQGSADTAGKTAGEESDDALSKLGVKLSSQQKNRLKTLADRNSESPEKAQLERASILAALGRLLEKPEITQEALTAMQTAYLRLPWEDYSRSSELSGLIVAMVKSGQGIQAEALLADELASAAKPDAQSRFNQNSNPLVITTALMWIYHQAGRSADIMHLLDHSPHWKVNDLSLLPDQSFEDSVLLMAAQALADMGKKDEARRIVLRALPEQTGKDALYALLLSLGGDDVEARLDALQKASRFEERPLIWKARWQFDRGRVDEAEKTIRAAIAIDPSDGEQGKGDRMRAYAVLGDILEKKGDAEQAKIMRGAVKAIRISEDADDLWNAGLLSRAVAMYESALLQFADAYCIQSRLALRYSEMGDFAKAEAHYQRAFELMPDSFGRVESHCFGCEGSFSGKRAQNIAEKVFTALVEKMPEKPQVHYLLGYLRDQQKRHAEAADHYRQAVKLDPDYLNAWKKLLATAEEVRMPKAERELAALALFRLSPGSGSNLNYLTNLRLLWDTLLAAEADLVQPETGSVYPLAAAAVALEKDPDAQRQIRYLQRSVSRRDTYRTQLSGHSLMQSTTALMQIVGQCKY